MPATPQPIRQARLANRALATGDCRRLSCDGSLSRFATAAGGIPWLANRYAVAARGPGGQHAFATAVAGAGWSGPRPPRKHGTPQAPCSSPLPSARTLPPVPSQRRGTAAPPSALRLRPGSVARGRAARYSEDQATRPCFFTNFAPLFRTGHTCPGESLAKVERVERYYLQL